MNEGPEVPAFRSKLEVQPQYSAAVDDAYIYKLEDRDDVVVRSFDWKYFLEKGFFRPDSKADSLSAVEFAQITKKHFDELQSYGVAVPVSFIVADQKDKHGIPSEEVLAVVDNIVKAEHRDKKTLGAAFAALRTSLAHYYGDKLENGGSFLADLVNDTQYAYGKAQRDTSDHLYLVDVEPYIYKGLKAVYMVINELDHLVQKERNFFSIPEYDPVSENVHALHERALERFKAV